MTFAAERLLAELQAGLDALGVSSDALRSAQLIAYLHDLVRWNRVFNLTSVRDPDEMLRVHLLDCCALLPLIHCGPVLDVGSGGGLPGLVIAILRPDLAVDLVDPVGKKTAFLTQVKGHLGLTNVRVFHGTVQALTLNDVPDGYRTITARAVAGIDEILAWCDGRLAADGEFLLMKSQAVAEELVRVSPQWHTEPLPISVPGLDATRCVVRVRRVTQPITSLSA